MVVASGLLALIVGGAFAAVLLTITDLRGTTDLRRQTREALVAADTLEKYVIDLETGLRGFVITRDASFLQPSNDARAALPGSARALERLAADEPVQLARVRRIVRAMNAYIRHYALPLVKAVRQNDPLVRSVDRTLTAKRRVDALREGLNNFRAAERARLSARDADVDQAARRATGAAAVGIAGSIVLIIVFSGYLTRVIVQPLRGGRDGYRARAGDGRRPRPPHWRAYHARRRECHGSRVPHGPGGPPGQLRTHHRRAR
jgi:CHASE3 domain sensor protein